ncbi:MAG: transporter associated domain-containing protein, partial [Oceanobacter sp.]
MSSNNSKTAIPSAALRLNPRWLICMEEDNQVLENHSVFIDDSGKILAIEESDYADVDTLGGLVFTLAGRIPARGEIITHP